MKNKRIVFTKPYTAELLDVEMNQLNDNDVKVKTMFSTISCGTEKANYIGDPNCSVSSNAKTTFPRSVGYSSSGVVVEVGKNVKDLKVGDRVVTFWGVHTKYNILNEGRVVKIEYDDVDFQSAAMTFISTFPLAAIRKTKIEIGESAMVMGLGILGIFAVKYLRLAGATPIIAVDFNKERREIALKNGADFAFDPSNENFSEKVKQVTNGGVNVAIEVTGVGEGLNEALDCMKKMGRVALLGCTRNSNFTVDYYKKVHAPGISLIGAHTNARPGNESYPNHFTHRDDIKVALNLLHSKRVEFISLIQEFHSPKDCTKVYDRLVNDKSFPIVSQFDWRDIDD